MLTENTKILLVDDEKRILEVFSGMLRDLKFSVTTASLAEDALRLVAADRFDIVFIDQFLGPTRGIDLMHKMSDICPELYFVVITGNGSADLALEALKSGASDFIVKPFLNVDLMRSIEYVKMKRELERQKQELLATLELKVNEKTEELKNVYFSALSSLTQAMEKKDMGTFGHSKRVSYNSRLIAAAMDLGAEDRNNLKVAALLHDIGKIGTSDMILGKKGPLTEEEKKIIREHPVRGVEILTPLAGVFKQLNAILPAILHHHENFDGSGYPDGRSGGDIPLLARIIAIADAYDAMLSSRLYRSAANHEQAIAELVRCAGEQFDPMIVESFVKIDVLCRRINRNNA